MRVGTARLLLVAIGVTAFAAGKTMWGVPAQRSTKEVDARQLVAYVLVSERCGFCQSVEVQDAIRKLGPMLREEDSTLYARVHVVGVAAQDEVASGVKFLEKIGLGSFDEVSVGRGWENEFVMNHIWRTPGGLPAVPQIIVVSRPYVLERGPTKLVFGQDSLHMRIVGRDDLLSWVERGEFGPAMRNEAGSASSLSFLERK